MAKFIEKNNEGKEIRYVYISDAMAQELNKQSKQTGLVYEKAKTEKPVEVKTEKTKN